MAHVRHDLAFIGVILVVLLAGIKVNWTFLSILSGTQLPYAFDETKFEEPRFQDIRTRGHPRGHPTRARGLESRGLGPLPHVHHHKRSTSTDTAASHSSATKSRYKSSDRPHAKLNDDLPLAPVFLRGRLKRRESQHFQGRTTRRVAHHVAASRVRGKYLHRKMFRGAAAATNEDFREGLVSSVASMVGGYSMSISLGSPPQVFHVMVDTGSDLTWVQSSACTLCFDQPSDGFQVEKSSTYKSLACASAVCRALGEQSTCTTSSSFEPCDYSYDYGDQSTTSGRLSTETLTIGATNGSSVQLRNFAFGVATDNSINFGGVDGILGLGRGPMSFLSQLGHSYGSRFSYCLPSFNDTESVSPIIFGDAAAPREAALPYSTSSYPEEFEYLEYTPLNFSDTAISSAFWVLNLRGFKIDDSPTIQAVPDGTQTIIDSGTTVSMLSPVFYLALRGILQEMMPYPRAPARDSGLDLCFDFGSGGNNNSGAPIFPKLTFAFELVDWVLPMENTFIPVDDEGTWCLAMIASTLDGLQIFGNIQQANFQVVYDQANSRLGFVRAQCDNVERG